MELEKKTICVMINMYCNSHYQNSDGLCRDCQGLLDYAHVRLKECPFKKNKPACAKCKVHCYQPDMRIKIKSVMKYSGPRMLFKYPILALHHLIQKFFFNQ